MEKTSLENLSPRESERRELWLELENVGAKKPVGYLPVETIENYIGKNMDEVIQHLQKKGLKTKVFRLVSSSTNCLSGRESEAKDPVAFDKGWRTLIPASFLAR